MQNKPGEEAVRDLCKQWPDMPVILCSGYPDGIEQRVADLRYQGFLKKPFQSRELLELIARFV